MLDDEKYEGIVTALLNYGAYTQKYFNYNTDKLANEGCTDDVAAVTGDVLNDYVPAIPGTDDTQTITYVGSTLRLEAAVKVRHYFTVAEGGPVPVDLQLYQNDEGQTYYYFESEGVCVGKWGEKVTYETENGYVISYSPMNYAATVLKNTRTELTEDEELQNVLKAMYLYYTAAKQYQF